VKNYYFPPVSTLIRFITAGIICCCGKLNGGRYVADAERDGFIAIGLGSSWHPH